VTAHVPLTCHAGQPCPAVLKLEASISLQERGILIDFHLQGAIPDIELPVRRSGVQGPTDGLWEHTCMEAFISTPTDTAYREFNFSPSGDWAAYAFDDYRHRSKGWKPMTIPQSSTQTDGKRFWHMQILIPSKLLPESSRFQTGLSAVIETRGGLRAYWALSHATAQPDFHDRSGFCLNISADK